MVTFLFADIDGSTRLLRAIGDRLYAEVLAEFRRLLRESVELAGGSEVDTQGDGLFASFRSPRDAVLAAAAAQRSLASHEWPEGTTIRARMGLHTGVPITGDGGYVGIGVHRAFRICQAGHGGQILLSQTTADMVEGDLPAGVGLRDLGEYHLKDLGRPARIFQAVADGLRADFPALRALPPAKFGRAPKAAIMGVALAILAAVAITQTNLLPRRAAGIESLAVLPLENLSRDPEQEYLADGMTDALISTLGQISALRVISRTSIMQYKEVRKPLPQIARELGVDAVVEGAVLRSGNRVRVTAQLIHAPTDRHLWARNYERDLRDVLAFQSEVARDIAQQIRIQLTPEERARLARGRPVDPSAYEAYLRGRYHMNRFPEGFEKALQYFRSAIERDPGYAAAYAGLADAYALLGYWYYLPPREAFPKALATATKAVELDERLAEAHAALAQVKFFTWDWKTPQRHFERALELNPNSGSTLFNYTLYLALSGRFDEALTIAKRLTELDPLTPGNTVNVGWVYFEGRRYDDAILELKKGLEWAPDLPYLHLVLGWSYAFKGVPDRAVAHARQALTGGDPDDQNLLVGVAQTLALAGERDEARKVFARYENLAARRYVDHALGAFVPTALGEFEKALQLLWKGYEQASPALLFLKVDPSYDPLRQDPRFIDLMKKVGAAP